jgi:hypothetical protein
MSDSETFVLKLRLAEAKGLLTDALAMLTENWSRLPSGATGLRQDIERFLVECERKKTEAEKC